MTNRESHDRQEQGTKQNPNCDTPKDESSVINTHPHGVPNTRCMFIFKTQMKILLMKSVRFLARTLISGPDVFDPICLGDQIWLTWSI